MMMSGLRSRVGLWSVLVLISAAAPCGAQIPDEFTNLQILPKDISKQDLVSTMRGFAGALGVRCNYCHVGNSRGSLEGFDFASDVKEEKKAARLMLRMVSVINDEHIEKVEELEHQGAGHGADHEESESGVTDVKVQCVTCHRGQVKPVLIEDVLAAAYRAGGVDSLSTRYRQLREEYYGRHTYDFGEWVLIGVAQEVAGRDEDVDEGLKLLKLNAEWFPESSVTHVAMGRAYLEKGDLEAARSSVDKALALEPDSRMAKRLLEQLDSQGEPSPSDGER
jgi:tetratricopeptide (TPR) repeat protein